MSKKKKKKNNSRVVKKPDKPVKKRSLTRDSFKRLYAFAMVLCGPLAMYLISEHYTHDLDEMWVDPMKLGIILYYLIFFVLFAITGRIWAGICLEGLIVGLAGLANYFVIQFRNAPIMPWDIYSIGVASSVAGEYDYALTARVFVVILSLLAICILSCLCRFRLKNLKLRLALVAVSLLSFTGFTKYVQSDVVDELFEIDRTLFTPTVYYRNNGYMLSFLINMRYLNIEKPAGYTPSEAEAVLENALQTEDTQLLSQDTGLHPNIIVIMNEAFSDLSVLGDYQTNMPVTPYLDEMEALGEVTKGYAYSSVKGGNTANAEYEFLTGFSMQFLPVGSIPYQQYIRSELPGMVMDLNELGYTSVALHPYNSTGWNRNRVYEDFGFDEMVFKKNMHDPEILRKWVSDWGCYEKIIDLYESKGDAPLFMFNVTMQNHGGYSESFDNLDEVISIEGPKKSYKSWTERYLSLLNVSDEAFKRLTEYFKMQEEPTIILMFGDHMPADHITGVIRSLENESFEEGQDRYIVPYYIWKNYDDEDRTDRSMAGTVTSMNYLGNMLMLEAGLPLNPFRQALYEKAQSYPVITANMVIDAEGQMIPREDRELKEKLKDYSILQYNGMCDEAHRLTDFFIK